MNRIIQGMLALVGILFFGFPAVTVAADYKNQRGVQEVEQARPITVLVLLDGFRADYLDRGVTPNLARLAEAGVRGKLTPAFPSVSMPNHFTQMTGLYPDEHGIVGNVFEDEAMPAPFNPFRDPESINDPRWWAGGIPLWALAEEQGLTATHTFWAASGYDRSGKSSGNFQPMEYKAPPQRGAARFLEWFEGVGKNAPDIAFLLFYQVDSVGHRFGPDAAETNAAIAQVDAAIGMIVAGLKQRGLWDRVNIVFTADHGMSKYVPGQVVFLDNFADPATFRLIGNRPYAEVVPENDATVDEIAQRVVGHHGPMTCWRKEELPKRFRFGKNARVAPIHCLADTGWIIALHEGFDPAKWNGAGHGYDPESSTMGALFLAHGPAFCGGKLSTRRIDAVDIYPLLADLAGIEPGPNSGDISHFDAFMRGNDECDN